MTTLLNIQIVFEQIFVKSSEIFCWHQFSSPSLATSFNHCLANILPFLSKLVWTVFLVRSGSTFFANLFSISCLICIYIFTTVKVWFEFYLSVVWLGRIEHVKRRMRNCDETINYRGVAVVCWKGWST